MAELSIFVGALAVAYLVPGPDMVLLLQTGASYGRAHALATAVGLAAARTAHVALAAVGLATLLKTAPLVFEIVRIAGAAYLIWLGIGILRTQSPLPEGDDWFPPPTRRSFCAAARRGVLTNLLNPKALLFCSVLLPQFVGFGHDVAGQFLLLGVILVTMGIAFDIAYTFLGRALGRWLRRHPVAQVVQRWVVASLLVGFGVRLALSNRPGW